MNKTLKAFIAILLAGLMIVATAFSTSAMQLSVKLFGGEHTISIEVEPTDTIDSVKEKISALNDKEREDFLKVFLC